MIRSRILLTQWAFKFITSGLRGSNPELCTNSRPADLESFEETASLIIAAIPSIAAKTFRSSKGEDVPETKDNFSYCENFLHMMFGNENAEQIDPAVSKALDLIFLLHADHEQNCSTSTCRMIASGGANAFASLSGAVSALWGPLHGGANMAVIKMLNEIHSAGDDGSKFIQSAKEGKSRLMGFGHRVYRNYDPRAKILKVPAMKHWKHLELKVQYLTLQEIWKNQLCRMNTL